jgi:hypothetical protein
LVLLLLKRFLKWFSLGGIAKGFKISSFHALG